MERNSNQPQLFSQGELNDLTRGLGISKDAAQLLGARLLSKHLLTTGIQIVWYRKRETKFVLYLSQKGSFVYYNTFPAIIDNLGATF